MTRREAMRRIREAFGQSGLPSSSITEATELENLFRSGVTLIDFLVAWNTLFGPASRVAGGQMRLEETLFRQRSAQVRGASTRIRHFVTLMVRTYQYGVHRGM